MASVWRGWASEAAWVQTSRTRLCSAQRLTTELHTHALGYIRLQSHEPHIQERLFSCSHETGCWTQNWTVYTNIRNSQRAAPPGKTRMLKVTTACAQGQMVVDQTTRPGCHSLLLLSPNINTLQKKKNWDKIFMWPERASVLRSCLAMRLLICITTPGPKHKLYYIHYV